MKTLFLTLVAACVLGGVTLAQEGSTVPVQTKPGQVEADTLRGPYWKLTAVGDLTPPDRLGAKEPHLTFHPGGSVTGSDGCNTIRGSYTVAGEAMKFAGLMGTLMSCSLPESIDRRFREALVVTRTWKITDGVLTLQDEKGTMLARFEARPGLTVPFSVLDLSPVVKGSTPAQAFRNTLDLARHVEQLGFTRYWLAEHHNMPGIASSATAVLIAHVASGTSRIRVGSGGIMLPNHPPLVIAEQFGTLESLHPGRIDLGIGRAPGTDAVTTRALRRDPFSAAEQFPDDVRELMGYFAPVAQGQRVRAVPGAGLDVPIWLLGSSMYSAELAAALGLPFAFASHFAPDHLLAALESYRRYFRPSDRLEAPYAMAAINVVAAATDDEAQRLFTSIQQQFINLRRGVPGRLQDPAEIDPSTWTPEDRAGASHVLHYAVVGGPATVRAGIDRFLELTGIDELMVTSHVYDHEARKRSFEIVAQVRAAMAA